MKWFERGAAAQSFAQQMVQIELFSQLTQRELGIVAGFVHRRELLAGEVVFDAGEEGQALYVIVSGKVAIALPGQQETPLAELQANNFFGELGLLDDWPRSAQARTLAPTELAVLFRGDFERLMDSHARIAAKITMQLARHLGLRLRQMLAAPAQQVSVQ